jgi:hypothetical protein
VGTGRAQTWQSGAQDTQDLGSRAKQTAESQRWKPRDVCCPYKGPPRIYCVLGWSQRTGTLSRASVLSKARVSFHLSYSLLERVSFSLNLITSIKEHIKLLLCARHCSG